MKEAKKVTVALLKAIRESGNQARFSRKHNLSRAYVSDLVRGRRGFSDRILKILGFVKDVRFIKKKSHD